MIQSGQSRKARARSRTWFALLALGLLVAGVEPSHAQAVPGSCPPLLGNRTIVSHDLGVSFCELCETGTVRIEVENPFEEDDDLDFSDIVVTEDLLASGLTYIPNSTRFSGNNISLPSLVEPVLSGPQASILTWTLPASFVMQAPDNDQTLVRLVIEFDVRRHVSVTEEGLVSADRRFLGGIELTPSCAPADRFATSTGTDILPLREPEPVVIKTGRNVDAGQDAGSYSAPVYAHENDDVIWRIEVQNQGLADLQDFEFSDSIVPGNFEIDWVCDTEAEASAAAGGASPAGCVAVAGVTEVLALDVAAVFGNGANPYIAAPAGGSGFYYFVGRVIDSCVNRDNTVFDVEWGCQVEPPPGGINQTSSGAGAGDSASLSTLSQESGVNVDVDLIGLRGGQPMGTRGRVRITIENNSGGTIKGGASGIRLRDHLPAEYVIDPTFVPTIDVAPAYGNNYDGMVDQVAWTNPAPNTFPLATGDPALPLSNTDIDFSLTSSGVHPDFPEQFDMIRHGDVVTVIFRTVLIESPHYDKVANLDVRTESPQSDPPGTDPNPAGGFPISNQLEFWFEEYCTNTEHHLVIDDTATARPEDIDVDIIGNELMFILTRTGDPLPLSVRFRNDGGHDAENYFVYVTFGEAMVVQTVPAGCSVTANPPLMQVWQDPVALPPSSAVYSCQRGRLRPGETERLDFEVVNNGSGDPFDDDLSFRVDVIGVIELSDGTPLWFPTPTPRPDGITDPANDYTIDGLRARVIGYDLLKDPLGNCSENNPPPASPDDQVEVGEECNFHIESGGWFGFQTPGFTYIAVQDIQVVDPLPDGQGYISSTDPLLTSTDEIEGVSLNPPPAALDEGAFDWTFNTVVPAERITEKDHWFRADVTTRMLNDPLDNSAPPNEHAALSRNRLTSTFDAVFFNPVSNVEEIYTLGPNTVGYPHPRHRTVDLTVTEPLLTVTKEVCNETRYGTGPACSNFVPLADDGDAFDLYVYRVTVANEAASSSVARAPAYDVTVTSVTDPSDQLEVGPIGLDVLDNDADALIDAADTAGEGVVTDSVLQNGVPAEVIASYTHSDALRRIDPGQSVTLYYRVDPDDEVAPLQQLVSSVTAAYDSLDGPSGSQSVPEGSNGEAGGARRYVSETAQATIQIIPVEVSPKQITATAQTPPVFGGAAQPVSIGEEVEFQLEALIPVAQLRSFVIRDDLPAGLRCSEALPVDLDAPPYDAAGFVPGGVITPTCTDTAVIWNFGDQTVTQSPRDDRRFDFAVRFIAQLQNEIGNQNDELLINGGASTVTTVAYVDEAGSPVVIPIGAASLLVQEPALSLTKAFSPAMVDAADLPRVTVTATNDGSATAYEVRLLDDLSAVNLSYAGAIEGAVPPVADLTTLGPEQPIFSWTGGLVIQPGETVSFSFAVEVDVAVEPLELFPNTIEAEWTSLPTTYAPLNTGGVIGSPGSATGFRNGALPSAGDPLNDYEAQASDQASVPPIGVTKVDLDPAVVPEIGAHKSFEITLALPEGVSRDVVLRDDLATGTTSYLFESNPSFPVEMDFVGIVSINGQPPSQAAMTGVPADGVLDTAVWSVGEVVTESEDDVAGSEFSPAIRIRYFARVANDLPTQAGTTLQNTIAAEYINGETGGVETETAETTEVVVLEPDLQVTKSVSNVTPGKDAADPPAFGDILQYLVTVVNVGDAVAYDTNFVDTLPAELALEAGSVPTALIDGIAVAGFVPSPSGAPDGPLVWGRGNGDGSLDIPVNSFLELSYRAVVRTPMPESMELANSVWTDWTSRQEEDVFERTGAGCPTITPPDDYCVGPAVASRPSSPVDPPAAIQKDNTQATAVVGEAFRYRITVPAAPYAFPIYDVRIDDDLAASAADLRLLSVERISGSGPWTPVNSGTATNLSIEDTVSGIDVPAGEQVVLEITVVLEDTPTNVSGLVFSNTASYVYNWLDGNVASQRPGSPGATPPMTIVGPDTITLEKTGPPTLTAGTPGGFTLDVHNAGTGPAWNLVITDRLPSTALGGTCETAPTIVSSQLFEADGVTPVSGALVEGSDFSASFSPEPSCELTLAMLSAAGALDADQRWIVGYEASLDLDSEDGAVLTNIAGAVEWFGTEGADPQTVGDRRGYTHVLTDGTVGVLDEEDAHTVNVALPLYSFEKTVANVTTGSDPTTSAAPGDTLRYRLRVENLSDVPLANFAIVDQPDRLNTPAVFDPGSLSLVTVPAGADSSGTSATGGASGTGSLNVANLNLPGLGDSAVVEFEIRVAPVVPNGTLATNQAQVQIGGVTFADSDDPGVNGPSDPAVAGDEDPTQVRIDSAPDFRIEKLSTFLDGDPSVLLAGEALRYTITVENIGNDDASDAILRDAVPVNTRYITGSTTLGGAPLPDAPGGTAPLVQGILLQTPQDPTPGSMPAEAASPSGNVAVVTFDVVVDAGLADGTVISNQAFLSAVVGGVADAPSDDPRTPIADDPTRDVVGNAPLLFAWKSVSIGVDAGSPGIVDPGDVLHYRIEVSNSGAVAATAARLIDGVPANTTWVADSLLLNGLPVGQPDGGVSPLAFGIAIASSDRTPPLPGPGAGSLTPGQTALVEFDLLVDAGVPEGTLIENQGVLESEGQPSLLTDGDGNPATGPEPTVVVVGAAQQLAISKDVSVVGGGAALPGGQLEYLVRVVNIGVAPAQSVVLRDDLDAGGIGRISYVTGSALLDGVSTGTSFAGSILTADYSAASGPLLPGVAIVLRFRVDIEGGLALGTPIANTAVVSWNDPTETASASVSLDVGGTPGIGTLSGGLWHDADFDKQFGGSEYALQDWVIELQRNGQVIQSAQSGTNGAWSLSGIAPNDTNGDQYALRFLSPGAGANTAALGRADSPFTDGLQAIADLVVPSGSNFQGLNLPIDPNGVVYDALVREPVVGATLQMQNAANSAPLPQACFDDPVQQGQVTSSSGYYKFDLNFSDPACPSGGRYRIFVVNPGGGFVAGDSQIIPPKIDPVAPAFDVPTCPGTLDDAVPATAGRCEVQVSELAPPPSVPARSTGTDYYVTLRLDPSQAPGSSQLFNNHVPVDPVAEGIVAITKSTPSVNVSRGQLVPYEITLNNELAVPLPDLTLVDDTPAGFRYVEGSAQVDGVELEPTIEGRRLVWTDLGIEASSSRSLLMLLAVGAGVGEGKFVNRVQAVSSLSGLPLSGEASATVRVVPDPTFACTDVMGKVFDDANRNGDQDASEPGLSGVRLVTARGLVATTDPHGRFHITCAVVPNERRGSNFILKLDDRSLPTGYRLSTPQVQVKRATAGKALRFRYGASIARVVSLDLADAVFETDSTEMREHWKPRMDLLLAELQKQHATLRLSYLGDVESASLVDQRLAAVEQEIVRRWEDNEDAPDLQVETEVYWRRGVPGGRSRFDRAADQVMSVLTAPFEHWSRGKVEDVPRIESVERNLPADASFSQWTVDPEALARDKGDRLEEREVRSDRVETVKLTDVVPPIRFGSGAAEIPSSTVVRLRRVLDEMQDLPNVRLQVVGHADDQPLTGALVGRYGDNDGLSRERAGEVAEFLQQALVLPPEAISFEWRGDGEPVASNDTPGGRARNRRVEVEVWYDELEEQVSLQEVVVTEDIKRVKVCRTETVCKLNYREGHARRARVRNLVAPLSYLEGAVEVSDGFVREVQEALYNLRDEQNVMVKFIGYTDDVPLAGRAARIYGTHLALSKARAHRVSLEMQEALGLPSSVLLSDGRGASRPLASNDSERGRSLNRRIEVEFWYDDPLQELSDGFQACPDPDDGEVVTRVYDPPWGRIDPLKVVAGEAVVPPGYGGALRRAMADIADRDHVRLRFVGYTANERLDRRTASVYGDDIGLSAARARRTMEQIQSELGLSDVEVEHEGRGYVHSNDVVNAGFIQGDSALVRVEVVYDELAILDDQEGVEILSVTRELQPRNPLALNLMHITVDGQPIDDPGRSVADIQRCTDVALDRADIRFRFDDLKAEPRLSIASNQAAVSDGSTADSGGTAGAAASSVRFHTYSNYGHYIERSEVRIFDRGASLRSEPLAVIEAEPNGVVEWRPESMSFSAPMRELQFVLRAYDEAGRFDETAPQSLWLVHGDGAHELLPEDVTSQVEPGFLGYGEGGPVSRRIPLDGAGSVQVQGSGIPSGHTVWLAGTPVPVDSAGRFVAEAVLPTGMHTVEVAVLDPEGNGELFLRDLELEQSDWFYVGIADLTLSAGLGNGDPQDLEGAGSPNDPDSNADGRLAFYLRGKFGDGWNLTASADTREGPVDELFSNFMDKSPEALFRRIDPDYHYPTFGDDGTVEQTAPTSGKFFVELTRNENRALWGNFKVGYLDNELAQVERGLYGANLHYQTLDTTEFGEQRVALDAFVAEPGTVPSREEFRGTGGSLYFLRVQDILQGSERVRIEVRDEGSNLVTGVTYLQPTVDYDIDYLQGRILLSEPLEATAEDGLLVRSSGLSGNEVWLVVQYEYTPGFEDLDVLSAGGQGHWWLSDFLQVGFTANRNDDNGADSSLYGANVTARMSTRSWLKLQGGRSDGLVSTTERSNDGGFNFFDAASLGLGSREAYGYRADLSVGFDDVLPGAPGTLSLYYQGLEAGYSAPGLNALSDTEVYGGRLALPIGEQIALSAKADRRVEDLGLDRTEAEVDLAYRLTSNWTVATGVRFEKRSDNAPIVPVTQEEGNRVDALVQVDYDSQDRWRAYGFGQATLERSGDVEQNRRIGAGGAYRLNDRFALDGEVSYGDLGPAVQVGTTFQESEETQRYFSYGFSSERGIDGAHQRRGNLVSGMRSRLSDSASVYLEDTYQHSNDSNGLARAIGMTISPTDRWTLGANWEYGSLIDARTDAETRRNSGGAQVAYQAEKFQVTSGIEYRSDETEQLDGNWSDRTTWFFRNRFKFQMNPDWRMIGKFDYSFSNSSLGDFFDGGYTEAVIGYAYRPVAHDRLDVLAKYTFFDNVPTVDQVGSNGLSSRFIQRSHIAAIDATYELTPRWSIGGKYAYRLGQVSLDRENPKFFDNNAHLLILRADWRFLKKWEALAEGRLLEMPDLDERRSGALLGVYRQVGKNLKIGVGYNFSDFSDDLTDLSYDDQGFFFNLVGAL